jgi:hypothetical protein
LRSAAKVAAWMGYGETATGERNTRMAGEGANGLNCKISIFGVPYQPII